MSEEKLDELWDMLKSWAIQTPGSPLAIMKERGIKSYIQSLTKRAVPAPAPRVVGISEEEREKAKALIHEYGLFSAGAISLARSGNPYDNLMAFLDSLTTRDAVPGFVPDWEGQESTVKLIAYYYDRHINTRQVTVSDHCRPAPARLTPEQIEEEALKAAHQEAEDNGIALREVATARIVEAYLAKRAELEALDASPSP